MVCASTALETVSQPATAANRVRMDFMGWVFGMGLDCGSETGPTSPVRGLLSAVRLRLTTNAPVAGSRVAFRPVPASMRSNASRAA